MSERKASAHACRRERGARLGVRKLALGLLASIVAVVAAELVWRALKARTAGPSTNPRYVVHDELLGWRYRPDVEVRHRTDEFDVVVRIDRLGFRRQSSMPDRPPTIVALGDSFTFGWGVGEHETWPARLEALLGASTWNLAVSGYSVDQEMLSWRERARWLPAGTACAPKLVLLLTCGNDLLELIESRSYGRAKPRFALEDGRLALRSTPGAEPWLERTSELYRSLRKHWLARTSRELTHAIVEEGRATMAAVLAELDRACRADGARLVVITTEDPWLGRRLDALGVAHFDLEARLKAAAATGAPIAFERDLHWTAHGNQVVAEIVAGELRARGFWPTAASAPPSK